MLNHQQKERIRTRLHNNEFNLNVAIDELMMEGLTKEDATKDIIQEIENVKRQMLFDAKKEEQKAEDRSKVSYTVATLVGIVGPVFNVSSIYWYVVAVIIGGGIGYWAYPKMPFAGLFGNICAIILLPITYSWYVDGRSSIIKIELLIPLALALIPSFIIGLLVAKLLYKKQVL